MKGKEKIITTIVVITIIVCIILVISGISMIISAIMKKKEIEFNCLALIWIIEGNKVLEFQIVLFRVIYEVTKPNYFAYVGGIIMTILGSLGIAISIFYKRPNISSKLNDQQKLGVTIIIITCFIILLIIGISLVINTRTQRTEAERLFLVSYALGVISLIRIFILIFGTLQPYYLNFIAGIFMIIIGVVGTIISIIIYKSPDIIAKFKNYKYIIPEYKKVSLYGTKPRKKIEISKCPACNAPLKKTPPCECDYCGTILK